MCVSLVCSCIRWTLTADTAILVCAVDALKVQTGAAQADDRLYSPYEEEEPCDEESLRLALCARRMAHGGSGLGERASMGSPGLGELFLGAKDVSGVERGRLSAVLEEGLQLLAGVF